MAQAFLTNLDLSKNQLLNPVAHVLGADPGSPAAGQFWYRSDLGTFSFENASTIIRLGRLDQISAPTASVDLNSQKIINLLAPTNPGDATNKTYVDGLVGGGIAWKNPVRVATTAAGTLATAFANGQTVDGVVLATGDRILIKDQAAGAENGIYTVNAAGAPTRATDADAAAEIASAAVFVAVGTANADSAWTMTTDSVTLGTTALTWVRFSGLGTVTAGAGLTKTGDTLDVIGTANRITVAADSVDISTSYAGQATITILGTIATGVWNGTGITVPYGGTGVATLTNHGVLLGQGAAALVATAVGATGTVLRGATGADPAFGAVVLTTDVTGTLPIGNGGGYTSAATAKTALGFIGKAVAACAAATSTVVNHALGTRDVTVAVYRSTTPWDLVIADVEMTDANNVTVRFAVAPTAGQYNIVVTG